ncbi:IWS1 [Candida theae]|uniref:Transcription factor IWS1 n=1 Tax=Candida theae TaxID=1198502 RepID=A0AAD5BD68_9ASCO|nr:IWS1 [Candida theae]KAI5957059.1 IWS1 [Candida theae]
MESIAAQAVNIAQQGANEGETVSEQAPSAPAGSNDETGEDRQDESNPNDASNNHQATTEEPYDDEEVINSIKVKKLTNTDDRFDTKKKFIRRARPIESVEPVSNEQPPNISDDMNPQQRKRLELEEKMTAAIKVKSNRRRKADEDDIERMQDDKIDDLKGQMINAANLDVEKNSQGQIATEKLKLLEEVLNILSRADLAESILDNNLLEAVRLWLEPLPDASMPAYQIQKELINSLETLPIKTHHLVASGIGKVLVFYQRSKRTEPSLKKVVDRLIGDWTRPILNKSDSYKDRSIQFSEYNRTKYSNKLSSGNKQTAPKTLYEQNAERRKRAAIPTARTAAYKIAPKVNPNLLQRQAGRGYDERFRKLNQKLTTMGTKRKATKKGGPSIEGRDLSI